MTELPIMLEQGHPIHRAPQDGDIHHPMIKGCFKEKRRDQGTDASADNVLNKLFHGLEA
jgi:hypothetical protein